MRISKPRRTSPTAPIVPGNWGGTVLVVVNVLAAAGIVVAGQSYYHDAAQHHRADVEQQLSAIAELKVTELASWRAERFFDAGVLGRNRSLSALVSRVLGSRTDAGAESLLSEWLSPYLNDGRYDQIRLIDGHGITRWSLPSGPRDLSSVAAQRVPDVLRNGRVTLQDFYRCEVDHRVHLALLVPIAGPQSPGPLLGVLVMRIDPAVHLYPFIQRWPTPSPTAETLLVRKEGGGVLFLNSLRFAPDAALTLKVPRDSPAVAAVQAIGGRTGVVDAIDYRGVPVVAALRQVPDSPWALVARVDAAEVHAPIQERLWQTAVSVSALLLATGASVILIWRHRTHAIHREQAESAAAIRTLNAELEQRVRERTAQLEAANEDLEAFSYSVSHDLRAPLRAISGYGRILTEDFADRLDSEGRRMLGVISAETRRMGQLIDDLLAFSRLGRQRMAASEIDMTALARTAFDELAAREPARALQLTLSPLPSVPGDPAMIRVVWDNLLSNAIKFTEPRSPATIDIGCRRQAGETVYFVKDDGVGFDMAYADKLFGVFQRLHSRDEFEGTGVGLALVQRIIHRHGGRVWAEGAVNAGAVFYFSLPDRRD